MQVSYVIRTQEVMTNNLLKASQEDSGCYGLNYVAHPPIYNVEVLTPSTSGCDCTEGPRLKDGSTYGISNLQWCESDTHSVETVL